ncbi:MAG: hypothetical protein F4X40_05200 [Chloroflexi bacterium]|nr:hypothetical protein [Chloroflexota bacterium]
MANRRENEDELLVQNWLRAQGHGDIRRPHSDPPDFVVGGSLAAEVTRLSRRITVATEKHSKGEEEARKPLTDQIARTIEQLGPPGNEGRSWVIDCEYDFSVPLPNRKVVSAQLSDALSPLLRPYDFNVVAGMHSRHCDFDKHAEAISYLGFPHLCLACGICLDLTEFAHDPAKFILPDGNVSDGIGMAVAAEVAKAVRNRIRVKSESVRNQNRLGNYGIWWLILVDHVGLLPMQILSQRELFAVRNQDCEFWDRVVVVSSRNVDWHFDLLPQ